MQGLDLRDGVKGLVQFAHRDLSTMWEQVTTPAQAEAALRDVLPALVDTYGSAAATLAADWYDQHRDEAEIAGKFSAIPAEIKDPGSQALIGWAASKATDIEGFQGLVEGGMQRRIANFSRQTITGSSIADPKAAGWQRVGSGECAFCALLIGRGPVYSEDTADFASHDHCNCSAVPAFDGERLPVPPKEEVPLPQGDAEKALAEEWVEKHPLPEPVKITERISDSSQKTGNGEVAASTEIPGEIFDALLPTRGGWTTSTRAKTVAELKKTPEGRILLKTLDSFQSGGSTAIPRLRTDIEKYLAGDVADLAQGRIDTIETLLSAVGKSNAGDRALWRGMSIPGSIDDVAARYAVGDDLDLSLASFSTDKKLAQGFTIKGAGKRVRGATRTPVLVEWVGEGKRALPIERISKSLVFANEKEWLGAGRYVIEGVKRVKRNGVETLVLQIRQKGIW